MAIAARRAAAGFKPSRPEVGVAMPVVHRAFALAIANARQKVIEFVKRINAYRVVVALVTQAVHLHEIQSVVTPYFLNQ
ncbi:hypothetical protein [Paraburkholderia unamae]|uniref:hypothetical protein n=1 Tax=Paraburkholderia unamae TaxID=219649 RepID=UPI001057C14D|nr:hypothetical protein [Paraburkholderia unamae]